MNSSKTSSSKKKKDVLEKIDNFVQERIIDDNLENIVGERFGRYSKYIIQDRALPDARDGLKPVQRRILFAMYKLGMFSNRPYKKSARIVGEVIGKYHPHGDTSVYDAMVRLSQDFKMLLPLIDMHGNNGSMDGDPAAAMRYTEARLSKYAEYLLQDINKKTVGFVPNFDDEELEPTVLPSKFPNLLVNGATGISAGYATEIPPHNIDEVINAVIYRIEHPDCSLDEIMEIIKGPDFPTGGIVQGIDGIRDAYETGRGKIVLRGKTEIVEKGKINQLVITEIPFDVNKALLVKKMSETYVAKNIDGIIEIRDESDREGVRIVVDIKKDANPEYIRDFFYKSTELQINYTFNMIAIHDKRPVQMGLLQLLDGYVNHQKEIITNRSNYELKAAKKRHHIVEGLISMTSILDAVIKTIRNSQNKKDAKDNLISNYQFTEEQAEAIVMLQLYRLTNTDIVALQNEKQQLEDLMKHLENVLSNEDVLYEVIKNELKDTLANLSTPRKTQIEHHVEEITVEVKKLIPKEDTFVMVTQAGYLKRIAPRYFKTDEETKLKEGDIVSKIFTTTTLDTILMFTNLGNYVFLPVQNIPEVKHKDFGYHVSTLVNIEANERIVSSLCISDFEQVKYLLLTTKNGLIKRTPVSDMKATRYSNALKATKLRDDDEVVSVDITDNPDAEVIVCTRQGFMNRYNSNEISIMAPPSFGVKAMELKNRPNEAVVAGRFINEHDIIVLLTENNSIKKFKPSDIVLGKKNNVGKQYIQMFKTVSNDVIDVAIVKKAYANDDLEAYIVGNKGYVKVDFATLKSATANTGKKINTEGAGTPIKFVITEKE